MDIRNGDYILPDIWNPDDSIKALKEGNKRFVEGARKNYDLGFERRKHLVEAGQYPHAVVLTCADSRVPPEQIFDQGLGDLFVLRIAGNILSQEEIGSMEYAVKFLKSSLIVILGHEECGAVTAAVESTVNEDMESTENLDAILGRLQVVVNKTKEKYPGLSKEELTDKSIDENVEYGLANLVAKSDFVVEKIKNNELQIVGAKYMLETGEIEFGEYYKL